MTFRPVDEQMAVLSRGCEHLYSEPELRRKLERSRESGEPLRVKLGLDPTAPDIHLGHTVVLGKMRQFQDFGHKAVLIIGDYTARIGDPSGRSKTRPVLSDAELETNAKTYFEQAGKVLLTSDEFLEVRRNSEWLAGLNLAEIIKLTSQMTVARMLERDTFAKRHKAGVEIYIHEFLYPLMQGHDSVAIRSDVELGGTDQTFNNLLGRDLQRDDGQEPQVVMIMPILVGTDGTEKMSKSLGNTIGVTDAPPEMFSRIMSIPDKLMANYFELLTQREPDEIATLTNADKTHPRKAKVQLGKDIVAQYHDADAAERAAHEFDTIHQPGGAGLPDQMPEIAVDSELMGDDGVTAVRLAMHCGFASTNGQAKRLVREGGLRLNGNPVADPQAVLAIKDGDVVQRGKRQFVRLNIP